MAWSRIIARVVVLLALAGSIINFVVFDVESSRLGGEAINGKVDAGRYFVGSHGQYTEVSREQFEWSKWRAHTTWATFSFFAATFVIAWVVEKKSKAGISQENGTK
jgi:hypothetical protein